MNYGGKSMLHDLQFNWELLAYFKRWGNPDTGNLSRSQH